MKYRANTESNLVVSFYSFSLILNEIADGWSNIGSDNFTPKSQLLLTDDCQVNVSLINDISFQK